MSEETNPQESATLGLSVELTIGETAINEASGNAIGLINTVIGNLEKVIAASINSAVENTAKISKEALATQQELRARLDNVKTWASADIPNNEKITHLERELSALKKSLPESRILSLPKPEALLYSNHKPVLDALDKLQAALPHFQNILTLASSQASDLVSQATAINTVAAKEFSGLLTASRAVAARIKDVATLNMNYSGIGLNQMSAQAIRDLLSIAKESKQAVQDNRKLILDILPGIKGKTAEKALTADIKALLSQLQLTQAKESREAKKAAAVAATTEATVSVSSGNSRTTVNKKSTMQIAEADTSDTEELAEIQGNKAKKAAKLAARKAAKEAARIAMAAEVVRPEPEIIYGKRPKFTEVPVAWHSDPNEFYSWDEAKRMQRQGMLGTAAEHKAHWANKLKLDMEAGRASLDVETPWSKEEKTAPGAPSISTSGKVFAIGIITSKLRELKVLIEQGMPFGEWQMKNTMGPLMWALDNQETMKKLGYIVTTYTDQAKFINEIAATVGRQRRVTTFGPTDFRALLKDATDANLPGAVTTFTNAMKPGVGKEDDVHELAQKVIGDIIFPGGETMSIGKVTTKSKKSEAGAIGSEDMTTTQGRVRATTRSARNTRGVMSVSMLRHLLPKELQALLVGLHTGPGDAELTEALRVLLSHPNAAHNIVNSDEFWNNYIPAIRENAAYLDATQPDPDYNRTLAIEDMLTALHNVKDRVTPVASLDISSNPRLEEAVNKIIKELKTSYNEFRSKSKGTAVPTKKDVFAMMKNAGVLELFTNTLGATAKDSEILRYIETNLHDDMLSILDKAPDKTIGTKSKSALKALDYDARQQVIEDALRVTVLEAVNRFSDKIKLIEEPVLTDTQQLQRILDNAVETINTAGIGFSEAPANLPPVIQVSKEFDDLVAGASREAADVKNGIVHYSALIKQMVALAEYLTENKSLITGKNAELGMLIEHYQAKAYSKVPGMKVLAHKEEGAGNTGTGGNIIIELYDDRSGKVFAHTSPDMILASMEGLLALGEAKSSPKEALDDPAYRLQVLVPALLTNMMAVLTTTAGNKTTYVKVLEPEVGELDRSLELLSKVLSLNGLDVPAKNIKGRVAAESAQGLVEQMATAGLSPDFFIEAQRRAMQANFGAMVSMNTVEMEASLAALPPNRNHKPVAPRRIPLDEANLNQQAANLSFAPFTNVHNVSGGGGVQEFNGRYLANLVFNAGDPNKSDSRNPKIKEALQYFKELAALKGVEFDKALQAAFGLMFEKIGTENLAGIVRKDLLPRLREALKETFSGSSELLDVGQQLFLNQGGVKSVAAERAEQALEAERTQARIQANQEYLSSVAGKQSTASKTIEITAVPAVKIDLGHAGPTGSGQGGSGGSDGTGGGPRKASDFYDDDRYSKKYKQEVGSIDINESLHGKTFSSLETRARAAEKEIQRLIDKLTSHVGGGFLQDTEKDFVESTKAMQEAQFALDALEARTNNARKAHMEAELNYREIINNPDIAQSEKDLASEAVINARDNYATKLHEYSAAKAGIADGAAAEFRRIQEQATLSHNAQLRAQYDLDSGYKQVTPTNEIATIAQQRTLAAKFNLAALGSGLDTEANRADAILKEILTGMAAVDAKAGETGHTAAASMDALKNAAMQEISILAQLDSTYEKLQKKLVEHAESPEVVADTEKTIAENRAKAATHRAALDTIAGKGQATAAALRPVAGSPEFDKAVMETIAAKEKQLILERDILTSQIKQGLVTQENLNRLHQVNSDLANKFKSTNKSTLDVSALAEEHKLVDPSQPMQKGGRGNAGKSFVENVVGLATWQVEWIAGMSILNAIGGAFTNSVGFAKVYEAEMRNVQLITQANTQQFGALQEQMQTLANTRIFSPQELGEGLIILGQAGFNAVEALKILPGVADLATATLSTLKISADIVTTAIEAFNVPIEKTGELANTLAAITIESKLELESLGTTFNYIAESAAGAGMTINQAGTAMGLMSNAGVRASTIGTSLRSILGAFMNPTEPLLKELGKVGMTVDDVNPRINNFGDTLKMLHQRGFSVQEAFAGLDRRVAGAVVALINNAEKWDEFESRVTGTSRATVMAEGQMNTFDAQGKRLGHNLQLLGNAVAGPSMQPLMEFTKILGTIVNGITSLINVIPKGVLGLGGFGMALAGVATMGATVVSGMKYLYGLDQKASFGETFKTVFRPGSIDSLLANKETKEGKLTSKGQLQQTFGTMMEQLINPKMIGAGFAAAVAGYGLFTTHQVLSGKYQESESRAKAEAAASRLQELELAQKLAGSSDNSIYNRVESARLMAKNNLGSIGELERELPLARLNSRRALQAQYTAEAQQGAGRYTELTTFTDDSKKKNKDKAVEAITANLKSLNLYYAKDEIVYEAIGKMGVSTTDTGRAAIQQVLDQRTIDLSSHTASKAAEEEAKKAVKVAADNLASIERRLEKVKDTRYDTVGAADTDDTSTAKLERELGPARKLKEEASSRYLKAKGENTDIVFTGAQTAIVDDLSEAVKELTKRKQELQKAQTPAEIDLATEAIKSQELAVRQLMLSASKLLLIHIPGMSDRLKDSSKAVVQSAAQYVDFLTGGSLPDASPQERALQQAKNYSLLRGLNLMDIGPVGKKLEALRADYQKDMASQMAKDIPEVRVALRAKYEIDAEELIEQAIETSSARITKAINRIQDSFKATAFSTQLQLELGLKFTHLDEQFKLAEKLANRVDKLSERFNTDSYARRVAYNNSFTDAPYKRTLEELTAPSRLFVTTGMQLGEDPRVSMLPGLGVQDKGYDWSVNRRGVRNDLIALTGRDKDADLLAELESSQVEIKEKIKAQKALYASQVGSAVLQFRLDTATLYNKFKLPYAAEAQRYVDMATAQSTKPDSIMRLTAGVEPKPYTGPMRFSDGTNGFARQPDTSDAVTAQIEQVFKDTKALEVAAEAKLIEAQKISELNALDTVDSRVTSWKFAEKAMGPMGASPLAAGILGLAPTDTSSSVRLEPAAAMNATLADREETLKKIKAIEDSLPKEYVKQRQELMATLVVKKEALNLAEATNSREMAQLKGVTPTSLSRAQQELKAAEQALSELNAKYTEAANGQIALSDAADKQHTENKKAFFTKLIDAAKTAADKVGEEMGRVISDFKKAQEALANFKEKEVKDKENWETRRINYQKLTGTYKESTPQQKIADYQDISNRALQALDEATAENGGFEKANKLKEKADALALKLSTDSSLGSSNAQMQGILDQRFTELYANRNKEKLGDKYQEYVDSNNPGETLLKGLKVQEEILKKNLDTLIAGKESVNLHDRVQANMMRQRLEGIQKYSSKPAEEINRLANDSVFKKLTRSPDTNNLLDTTEFEAIVKEFLADYAKVNDKFINDLRGGGKEGEPGAGAFSVSGKVAVEFNTDLLKNTVAELVPSDQNIYELGSQAAKDLLHGRTQLGVRG